MGTPLGTERSHFHLRPAHRSDPNALPRARSTRRENVSPRTRLSGMRPAAVAAAPACVPPSCYYSSHRREGARFQASRPRGPGSLWASSRQLSTAATACPDAHAFLPPKRAHAASRAPRLRRGRRPGGRGPRRSSQAACGRVPPPRSCGGTRRALSASAVRALNKCVVRLCECFFSRRQ